MKCGAMKYCLSALGEIDRTLQGARRILIASDFDGTLCPIAASPSEVSLAPATIEILRRAAACSRVTLAVISGRALADLRRRVPVDILFGGNHGLELAGAGIEFEHQQARELRPIVAAACESLDEVCGKWAPAWVEDKGLSATLHFRAVNRRQHNSLLFAARRCLGAFGPKLALRVGRLALEIRPRVGWDKGSALAYIQENAGPFEACICLGDDRTDESMFRANPGQVNVRIGLADSSAATHYLQGPGEVAILLSHLVDRCGSDAPVVRNTWAHAAAEV
jgi:trehalose 6-phosphate phosphatase